MSRRYIWIAGAGGLLVGALLAGGTLWLLRPVNESASMAMSAPKADGRKVLYWYDPMYPQQHFDQPGPSPFMDMALIPRYADETGVAAGLRIAADVTQNVGIRVVAVKSQTLTSAIHVSGVLTFNERDVAVVQTRSAGFVERVYDRAPEDVLKRGAPLADLLVPEWGAVQEEYLALRDTGQPALLQAARQRMRLAGMPEALIAQVAKTGKVQNLWTITTPIAGMLESLEVRSGMSLTAGQSLARINGLSRVWLEVAVPEAQSAELAVGQPITAQLPALPGETLNGTITALLPQASLASRSIRVRVELPNPALRLRPGMTAQVQLRTHSAQRVLVVPSEAVIRTGQRSLVMLAEAEGRYRPVTVRVGRDNGELTEVLEGLQDGQQVVASGQFLLDSEASLRGLLAQPASSASAHPAWHTSEGTLIALENGMVTISHGPFKTLGMPGMTMPFPLADLKLAQGLAVGDHVRFAVEQTDDGLVIRQLDKQPSQRHQEHQP